jgi:hypothetical protein
MPWGGNVTTATKMGQSVLMKYDLTGIDAETAVAV